jgi:hypothetical protein
LADYYGPVAGSSFVQSDEIKKKIYSEPLVAAPVVVPKRTKREKNETTKDFPKVDLD